jgi:drug/metabolite transporter (DMT)-like permease
VLWALAVTALAGTVACFIVQAWAQRFTPPTHTALIFTLEPVFAGLTSYALIGERLGSRGLLGAALILAGVVASELLGQVQKPEEELAQEAS